MNAKWGWWLRRFIGLVSRFKDLTSSWFESWQGLGIFLFTTASRPALRLTQPPIEWVPWALSREVKRPEREADHSPPSSDKFKNARRYTSTPQYILMAWCSWYEQVEERRVKVIGIWRKL
jgi:hypothetical protein